MPKSERSDRLEIAEDMDFQRASWRVQRVGWAVMSAIVVAALLGFFGGGPLSSAQAGDAQSGLSLEYDRFTRLNSPQTLDVQIAGAAIHPDSTVRFWLDRKWIESNEVSSVSPEPEAAELEADRIIYTFKTSRSTAPLRARFHLENRAMGIVYGRGGLVGGQSYSFKQFSYP